VGRYDVAYDLEQATYQGAGVANGIAPAGVIPAACATADALESCHATASRIDRAIHGAQPEKEAKELKASPSVMGTVEANRRAAEMLHRRLVEIAESLEGPASAPLTR
jgi:hypothetical protein